MSLQSDNNHNSAFENVMQDGDSGYITDAKNHDDKLKNSNGKTKADRYAIIQESDLGEDEMKMMINSPPSGKTNSRDQVRPLNTRQNIIY
jgi:hypothetical protein